MLNHPKVFVNNKFVFLHYFPRKEPAMPRSRLLFVFVSLVASAQARAAPPAVSVESVEPVATAFNPDARLLHKGFPARFHVTLENRTNEPQRGTLAAEVVGNLESVYGLTALLVELGAREKRTLVLAWNYPVPVTYQANLGPTPVPGAVWGHQLNVAWLDADGRVAARGRTVFAVAPEGAEDPELRKWARAESLTPAQAFTLRYRGYFAHPDLKPLDKLTDLPFTLSAVRVAGWKGGTGPAACPTYLAEIGPSTEPAEAVLYMTHPGLRLRRAWLLDPHPADGPRAQRLFARADQRDFVFTVPAAGRGAVLVLELERTHFVAGVPVAEIAAIGEKQAGPFRDFLRRGVGKVVTTPEQWTELRQERRAAIRQALGSPLRTRAVPLEPKLISEETVPAHAHLNGLAGTYLRRKVSLHIGAEERMNVWLLVPPGIGPFPAVVACHQTVAEGKDEPVGLGGHHAQLNYGPFLAGRGFVVLAADSYAAGERIRSGQAAYATAAEEARDPAWSLLGQRLHDHQRVLDYLQTLPFVDATRVGVIGHSLGGESAAVLTAMDDRVGAAVISCPFTLMRTLANAADIYAAKGNSILSADFRPLLMKPVKERRLPFDFDDCMALWAPRPVFYHGVRDDLWPNAPQVAQAGQALRAVYRLHGKEERWRMVYSGQTHCFPGWLQPDAFDWLEYWLKRPW